MAKAGDEEDLLLEWGRGEGVRVLETHQITYMRMSMAVMMGVIQWRIGVQYWHPG